MIRIEPSELERMRMYVEKARPGPWTFEEYYGDFYEKEKILVAKIPTNYHHGMDRSLMISTRNPQMSGFSQHWSDAEFICAARTDMPKLLAAYEALLHLCALYLSEKERKI